jgi:hypothetical protein
MANEAHLAILKEALEKNDIEIWDQWRTNNPSVEPDLSEADLSTANLHQVNLSSTNLRRAILIKANLTDAILTKATLIEADLSEANLSWADLSQANLYEAKLQWASLIGITLYEANLQRANLGGANLNWADLRRADLSGAAMGETTLIETDLHEANLSGADLSWASLIETDFTLARLDGCSIYGISTWDVKLEGTLQKDLNISEYGQPPITVDNLKIAQFIYLVLSSPEIRDAIDTVAKKAVLILGRFAPERKVVLDAIREDLRSRGFLPILFDFEKPSSRDLTETVVTLAHLSGFVIADLTNPSSIPHELMSFTRDLPSVPVQPIILKEQRPYAMFLDHLGRYPWVLPYHEYESQDTLLAEIAEKVIQPAQDKAESMKPKPF